MRIQSIVNTSNQRRKNNKSQPNFGQIKVTKGAEKLIKKSPYLLGVDVYTYNLVKGTSPKDFFYEDVKDLLEIIKQTKVADLERARIKLDDPKMYKYTDLLISSQRGDLCFEIESLKNLVDEHEIGKTNYFKRNSFKPQLRLNHNRLQTSEYDKCNQLPGEDGYHWQYLIHTTDKEDEEIYKRYQGTNSRFEQALIVTELLERNARRKKIEERVAKVMDKEEAKMRKYLHEKREETFEPLNNQYDAWTKMLNVPPKK